MRLCMVHGATRCLVDRGKSSHLLLAIHPRSCRATQALDLRTVCSKAHLFTWPLTWSTLQRMAGSLCILCTLYAVSLLAAIPGHCWPPGKTWRRRNRQSTWQRTLYPVVAVVNMAGWADHDTWWNVDFGSRASGAAWRYFKAGTPWGLTFPSSKTFFTSGSQAGPLCQKP